MLWSIRPVPAVNRSVTRIGAGLSLRECGVGSREGIGPVLSPERNNRQVYCAAPAGWDNPSGGKSLQAFGQERSR